MTTTRRRRRRRWGGCRRRLASGRGVAWLRRRWCRGGARRSARRRRGARVAGDGGEATPHQDEQMDHDRLSVSRAPQAALTSPYRRSRWRGRTRRWRRAIPPSPSTTTTGRRWQCHWVLPRVICASSPSQVALFQRLERVEEIDGTIILLLDRLVVGYENCRFPLARSGGDTLGWRVLQRFRDGNRRQRPPFGLDLPSG